MRVVAARAGKLLPVPRRVPPALDRVDVSQAVSSEDVLSILLVIMTGMAEIGNRLYEERRAVRRVRIVAAHAVTRCHRWMDGLLAELLFVVALKTQLRHDSCQGFRRLVLSMRRLMTGWTTLLHLGVLGNGRMDRSFCKKLLMAVHTGTFHSGSETVGRRNEQGQDENGKACRNNGSENHAIF
jgi:hypothetical protein